MRVWYGTVHVKADSRISLVVSPAEEVILPGMLSWVSELPDPITVVSSWYTGVAPFEVFGPGWQGIIHISSRVRFVAEVVVLPCMRICSLQPLDALFALCYLLRDKSITESPAQVIR